jgi:hypothetical protein
LSATVTWSEPLPAALNSQSVARSTLMKPSQVALKGPGARKGEGGGPFGHVEGGQARVAGVLGAGGLEVEGEAGDDLFLHVGERRGRRAVLGRGGENESEQRREEDSHDWVAQNTCTTEGCQRRQL